VLDRERLDRGLVDLPALLGFVQERLKRCFKQGAQFGSTPYVRRNGARGERTAPYKRERRALLGYSRPERRDLPTRWSETKSKA
jgi:hypothetical protein